MNDGYFLEKLVLELNGLEGVPAYSTRPATGSESWPTVTITAAIKVCIAPCCLTDYDALIDVRRAGSHRPPGQLHQNRSSGYKRS